MLSGSVRQLSRGGAHDKPQRTRGIIFLLLSLAKRPCMVPGGAVRNAGVRFATFNVNSIRARLPATLAWLDERKPDVAVLQETKVVDADFPSEEFLRRGYGVAMSGQKTYNGVAILSRSPMTDIRLGLLEDGPDDERRYISATVGDLRCVSVYVPNGKDVGHPAFQAKLDWLERLSQTLRAEADGSNLPVVVGGDFNIAADERDVWSPEALEGKIHFHPDERAGLRRMMGSEFFDAYRMVNGETKQFSWWDYRGPSLRLNRGLRIDYVFLSTSLKSALTSARIDAAVRQGERPSDHVPVVVELSCS